MVKAPRSKGCRVCVERRVKCDQARPFCVRCQRANRACPGYETTKFIDEGPSVRALYDSSGSGNVHSSRAPSSASSSSAGSPERETGPKRARRGPKSASNTPPGGRHPVLSPVNADNWRSSSFERAAMTAIICPTTLQSQLLAGFIDSIKQPSLSPTFRCHSLWLREMAAMPDPSPCLLWAIRAISISHLGRLCKDDQIIETSRRVYGKALLKLNDAIQDPEEGYSSDTLSATLLLSFYEILNCTRHHSWIKHAGGAGQLIRHRGPGRHRNGFDRLVLMACRYLIILEAFNSGQPCFLDAPEWHTLFWEIHRSIDISSPMVDSNEDFFQQIVTFPSYIGRVRRALDREELSQEGLENLMSEGQTKRTNFQDNHRAMATELRAAGKEPRKTASSYNDTVFPVVYEYADIHIASLYCGYWCMLIVLNITIVGLQAKVHRLYSAANPNQVGDLAEVVIFPNGVTHLVPKASHAPLWDAARSIGSNHLYYQENQAYAREICKSAEFIQNSPFIGPLFLVLSLRMSLRMDLPDAEKTWMVEKLNGIGDQMELARAEIEMYVKVQEPAPTVSWQGQRWGSVPGRASSGAMVVRSERALEQEKREQEQAHEQARVIASNTASLGIMTGSRRESPDPTERSNAPQWSVSGA